MPRALIQRRIAELLNAAREAISPYQITDVENNFIFRWMSRVFSPASPSETQQPIQPAPQPHRPSSPIKLARNWDGHVREQAMQALAQLDPHEAIPELLVRTNDWVPQVRYAAKKALRSLMTDENAAAFIDYLPEIAHLGRQQRDDHAILIEEVHAYLLRPHNTQHLIRAVSTAQPRVARIASRLCMEHALLPEQALLSACLASADMLTRMSIMPLLYQGSIQDRLPLLAMAVANSCMQLRRAAFVVYCREQHAASTAIAQSLLFDRSAALRELAMGVLAKRGISVPDLLQPVLEQPSATPEHLRHAIWGAGAVEAARCIPPSRRVPPARPRLGTPSHHTGAGPARCGEGRCAFARRTKGCLTGSAHGLRQPAYPQQHGD